MPSASLLKEVLEAKPSDRKMVSGRRDEVYDPTIDYYSIDWHCTKDCRWVRNAFVQLDELSWYGLSGCSKGESVFQTAESFRVLPEKWLSEPRQNWNEEIKSYVPDFITNRQFIFDNRYEDSAVLNTAQQSLSQLTADKETKEEWFNRIKEDPRMKEKFLKKGAEGGCEYMDGQYAHLSLVDGKWVSDKKKEEVK